MQDIWLAEYNKSDFFGLWHCDLLNNRAVNTKLRCMVFASLDYGFNKYEYVIQLL